MTGSSATKPRVLFMCTGNSARSQMSEALLHKYAGDRFEVFSAGLDPKTLHPLTVQVLQEIGIDTSHLRAKGWRDMLDKGWFRYVVFVCASAEQKCPTTFLAAKERLAWPFDDPAAAQGTDAQRLSEFRRVRDEIEDRIREWLAEIPREPEKS